MSDGVFTTSVLCLYVVHDVQHWKTWNKFQEGKSFKENCASLFVFKSSVICNLFQCLENSSVLTKTTKQLTRCFLFSIFSLRASRPLPSSLHLVKACQRPTCSEEHWPPDLWSRTFTKWKPRVIRPQLPGSYIFVQRGFTSTAITINHTNTFRDT